MASAKKSTPNGGTGRVPRTAPAPHPRIRGIAPAVGGPPVLASGKRTGRPPRRSTPAEGWRLQRCRIREATYQMLLGICERDQRPPGEVARILIEEALAARQSEARRALR